MIDDEDVILRKFGVLVCSGTHGAQAALVARLGASEGGRALLAALDFDADQAETYKDAVARLGQGVDDNPHRFVLLYEDFATSMTLTRFSKMIGVSWAGSAGLAVVGVARHDGWARMEATLGVTRLFAPDGDPVGDIYPAMVAASKDLSAVNGAGRDTFKALPAHEWEKFARIMRGTIG
jgi:hypothetical protein